MIYIYTCGQNIQAQIKILKRKLRKKLSWIKTINHPNSTIQNTNSMKETTHKFIIFNMSTTREKAPEIQAQKMT